MFKQLKLNSFRTYLFAFAGAIVLAFLARTLWFYHGIYVGPSVPDSPPESIPSLSNSYDAEQQLYGPGNLVVFDMGHDNGISEEELGLLAGRMATGGAQVELSSDVVERLHEATVFVSITPSGAFSQDEIVALEQFVRKGGRVILVGDPTRVRDVGGLNSLANEFGVVYQQDYIYNIEKNDGNFRNVIFSNFAEDSELTDGLDSIVFQTAHSLRAAEETGVVFGDDSTFVSSSERPGGVIAAALVGDGRVLLLPDMTFLTAPYNSFADNDHFIDNIVGFALSADRAYEVDDFPYYFGATTDIVFQDPAALDDSFSDFDALRDRFTGAEKTSALVSEFDKANPTVYLSTYDDVDSDVETMLDRDGVTVDGSEIVIEDIATLDTSSTVLFHLVAPKVQDTESDEEKPRIYTLIVLGDSQDDLSTGLDILLTTGIGDCMITGVTAVCQTDQTSDGESPDGGDTPSEPSIGLFLVVADDETAGSSDLTSADIMAQSLTDYGHLVDTVDLINDGPPSASDMLSYDAVFWSSGSYAPTESSVEILKEYLDGGGRLFIDGAEVAFYWAGDEFLTDYLHAEYLSYGTLTDLEVGPDDHPLNVGFGGVVIQLSSGTPPDIIEALDGDVVFVRGPDSADAGTPSLVAYEGDNMVAFASFQVSLMDSFDASLLINNAAAWFLSQ